MPSENNHIDNFFRNKSSEASGDYSRVEADWQQMQLILPKPEIVPVKKPATRPRVIKYIAYAAGAALIVVSSLMVTSKINRKNENIKTSTVPIKSRTNPVVSKTIPAPARVATKTAPVVVKKQATSSQKKNEKKNEETFTPILAKINPPDQHLPTIKPDSKTVFANFYDDLKTPAQEFVINTQKDTTIYCKEGTSIFVPAGSFQTLTGMAITGIVTMYIQEFYSYADILGNKLSTSSAGMPIETGGMLNINASFNSEFVKIRPGAALDLKMPARDFKPEMQLFIGKPSENIATAAVSSSNPTSWVPVGQQQMFFNDSKKIITIPDFRNEPYAVRDRGGKSVAKFKISYHYKPSNEEARKELVKRYGKYYDIIRVSREWKPMRKKNRVEYSPHWYDEGIQVGDNINIPLHFATRFKLITHEDSLRYEEGFKKQLEDAIKQKKSYEEFIQKNENYFFQIQSLGWINCDRFLGYPRSRLTDIALDPGAGFEDMYFQGLMVFEKEKAIMPGYWNNGKVVFPNLPVGHVVHVICTGAKDGKMYASIQKMVIKTSQTPVLEFEETSPGEYRNKLSQFGSVK
jgi:hypothetical protein